MRCDEGPRRRKRESKSNAKERILYGKGIDEEIELKERGGIEWGRITKRLLLLKGRIVAREAHHSCHELSECRWDFPELAIVIFFQLSK